MTPALVVRDPGLSTTVQDRGRVGLRAVGVPTSGALDQAALRLANALAGAEAGAAVLEILALGPTLEAVGGAVRFALVGDAPRAQILEADGGARPAATGRSHTLQPGDAVKVGPLGSSFCACLAVEGGVDVAPVLGSRSTYARGGFGGFEGRALRKGDRVPVGAVATPRPDMRFAAPMPPDDAPVRVVPGPQDDAFTPEGLAAFLGGVYRVTTNADRMGFRLEGPPIEHREGPDIVSDGAVAGSIQVPGSRQPIVLLADGQSVGGYAKIATVASCDLPRLVRAKPGASLRFEAVTQAQAEALARQTAAALDAVVASLVEAVDGLDLRALYDANLVSGVTDAR